MDLYQNELKQLQDIMTAFDAGKLDFEKVETKLAIIEASQKYAVLQLKKIELAAKIGGAEIAKKVCTELVGTTLRISPADPEAGLIECPALDNAEIERQACLDYSGGKKFSNCDGCLTGLAVKNLLLGPKI